MNAALDLGVDVLATPIPHNDNGIACAELWVASLRLYFTDAQAAWRGKSKDADEGEAVLDLLTDRALLANLCAPLDLDADLVGDGMLKALRAGKAVRKW